MHASVQPHIECPSIFVECFLEDIKEMFASKLEWDQQPKE